MPIITKKYKFCAAHKYHNPIWTSEENLNVFGDDVKLHGHNYVLEVSIIGPINSDTGFIIDLMYLNDIVNNKIIKILDHSNIQDDIPWFKNKLPSSENLTVYVWERLISLINKPARLFCIKIHETPKIFSEYYGEGQYDK